ncbi:hypothetical protein BHM03_00053317 [Ensete ventricosum]|nr:hypothetical protein BHM03_00053317 [Ensete ventricosum]
MAFRRQSTSPLLESCVSSSPPVICPSRVSRLVRQSFARVACLGQSASPLPESHVSASPPVLCPSRVPRLAHQSFARVACLGQFASPLPESHVSANPPVLCPSRMSRPVRQSFARVVCLGQSASPLPESHVSANPPVLCPSRVPRPARQSFARVACLGQSANPLLESHVSASPPVLYSQVSADPSPERCTSSTSVFPMDQRRPELGVIPLIHEVPRRDPSRGGGREGKNDRVSNGSVRLIQARARWTATVTLRRKPRQPKEPSRRPIWNPRWRCPNTTQPDPCPLMQHGDPCPRHMPL